MLFSARHGRARRRHLQRRGAGRSVERRSVLGIDRLRAAAGRLDRNPVVLLQPLGQRGVLARQEVRHVMSIGAAVLGERRSVARFHRDVRRQVNRVRRRLHVRLVLIDRIVHDGDDGEDLVVAGEVIRHRVHVARLRPAALEVAVFQVRGRNLQRVADPLAGGEAGPAVRRPRRRMRTAVHEDRPVERSHELDVIRLDLARQRVLLLQDARAAEAAPLVRRRVRPALILGRAPDRLRRGVRALAAGGVEGNAQIVAERRLRRRVFLVVRQVPLARDVRWSLRTGGLGEGRNGRQYQDGE